MRKYLLAAVAAAALTTPAFARDGAPYITIEGGAVIARDTKFDLDVNDAGTITSYDDAFIFDYKKPGWEIGGIIGYDLGPVRIEAEAAYKRLRIKDVTASGVLLTDLGIISGGPVVVTDFGFDDRVSVLSGMANLLLDIGDESGFNFYVGGGAGRARVKILDDRDSAWAFQGIAGVRKAISDNVDVGLKYRYFQTANLHFGGDFDAGPGGVLGLAADGKIKTHSLLASLTFNFGGSDREPEPEPYVAPPPPPAPVYVAPPPPPPPPPPAPVYEAPPPPLPSGERG